MVIAHPLSFGQERLWFLDRLDPGDASYNIQQAQRLRGPLRVDVLRRALDGIVARHEVLRSRFPSVDGRPAQVVDPAGPVPVEYVDAGGDEGRAYGVLAARSNAPFDLAAGPLLRVTLVRLSDDEHIFSPVFHHSVADGWSMSLFLDELVALYEGRELAPLPMQYGEFAAWQRERAGQLDEALAYWRAQLEGAPALELPTDRPRAAVKTSNGALLVVELPGDLADAVDRLARQRRCTAYMVLLAAYQVLLGRHSGQDDFCVGSPIAGRERVEVEPLIGYFTNTLVLRADLSDDPTFGELLGRTRATAIGAYRHQEIPFERLMTELRVERDLSRSALFQTLFTLHTEESAEVRRLGDVEMGYADAGYRQTKVDLMVDVWRKPDALVVNFAYNTDLFDEATVARLAERFRLLLGAIVTGSDTPISQLAMLTGDDHAVLKKWGTGPAAPEWGTVPEHIGGDPEATAVVCGAASLTYAELDERAARLAGALAGAGVVRGDIVGVCLDRSPDAVVALLAAWKAGAAYLPLDPEYPVERLSFMVADSGAKVVVTDRAMPGAIAPDASGEPVHTAPNPDDLAYVIYTSGSTGTPKGVAVPHRALAARVRWMRGHYGVTAADRVVQFASLSFDTHAEEVYPCLTAGATLVLVPGGVVTLPEFLPGSGATVLDLPTPYWHELVSQPVAWPDGLRLVILGADQVQADAVTRWRERVGGRVRLVNSYGPTETTIIATAADLDGTDARPPIGRPLAETGLAVRDPHGALVPPSVPGELWIGGAGVARGYLNRPELTAERFVDGWYRTGDRVRWRPDGQLEFLGRLDSQVKVRGYRVEPGEIEARLRSHPDVDQVAVVARGDSLVAYLTGTVGQGELRAYAAAALPGYMVPNTFVALDRLPLTANGKLDVAALPAPDQRPELAEGYLAPRGDSEQLVADVWADALGLDKVGALDDFFDLGGHSLLATRVVSRLAAAIELEVPIRTLFTHRTVAAFADAVEELLVAEIEQLSDDAAQRMLSAEGSRPR